MNQLILLIDWLIQKIATSLISTLSLWVNSPLLHAQKKAKVKPQIQCTICTKALKKSMALSVNMSTIKFRVSITWPWLVVPHNHGIFVHETLELGGRREKTRRRCRHPGHQGSDARRCSTSASGVPAHTKCHWRLMLIHLRFKVYSLLNVDCISFQVCYSSHFPSMIQSSPSCASLVAYILHEFLHTGMPCQLNCLF